MSNIPDWYQDEINHIIKISKTDEFQKQIEVSLEQAKKLPLNWDSYLPEIVKRLTEESTNVEFIKASNQYEQFIKEIINNDNYYLEKSNANISIKSKKDRQVQLPTSAVENALVIKNIISVITADECFDFMNYLSKYPMLGYKSEIGFKIFNSLLGVNEIEINNIRMFRIKRPYNISRPYVEDELFKGPYLKTDQGRFSNTGLNYIYFSENLETAKDETNVEENKPYTFIEVELKEKKRMYDISNIGIPLFNACHKKSDNNTDKMEINYLIPNFIANCINSLGYDGIKYLSAKDLRISNYVFFDIGKKSFDILNLRGLNF